MLGNAFDSVHDKANRILGEYAPAVWVSTRPGKANVQISIRDNGPGIPPSLQKKIFEPFFTTKPTGSGTGLGLSLSYDIITQGHGGALRVDSQTGAFTEFIVELPR